MIMNLKEKIVSCLVDAASAAYENPPKHIIEMVRESVIVSPQHAHSLIALVQYFKGMIETGNVSDEPGRSDELTIGYLDELLEGLKQ